MNFNTINAKLILSFNQDVINKEFDDKNNISLCRLIEDFQISEWASIVADGEAIYQTKSDRKKQKEEFFNSKKSKFLWMLMF